MKTNKYFYALMATAMTLTFTACGSDNDDDVTPVDQPVVVGFENQTLNADGFWIGEENENGYDSWGSTVYPCSYTESDATFNTTYGVFYWSGYAISNRTATTYADATQTPDQYNNIAGKAYAGKNFCVVQTYGETINFKSAVNIKGFYYTNSAYTVEVIKNGNAYAKKFEATDWLTCTVTGTLVDGTTKTVDIKLAENGSYVKDWLFADLSSLGKVASLSFVFTGSDSGDYGLNTPAYMCIDNLTFTK